MNCPVCNKEFEEAIDLTEHLVKEHKYSVDEVYTYFKYSFETREATCPICNTPFKMDGRQVKRHNNGTSKAIGCCAKCSRKLLELVYGNPSTWPGVKEKRLQTVRDTYGVDNVFQLEEVKKKSRSTMQRVHGATHPLKLKKFRDKKEQTTLEIYGVTHISKSEKIKKKKEQTSLEHFGVTNVSKAEEVKEKKMQRSRERYGTDYTLQAKEVRDKGKETLRNKHGVDYAFQAEEVKAKIRDTVYREHGVQWITQAETFKDKTRETNLKKRGVEHIFEDPEVREKARKTNRERHGVDYFCQHEKCYNANHSRISKINKGFSEILRQSGVQNELEFILEDYGYDLKVGDTLIEINPSFTHNVTKGPTFGKKERSPIPSDYHLKKTQFALDHGFSCIHIFDWDDKKKIVNMFKEKEEVCLQDCEIVNVALDQANSFLDNFYYQGYIEDIQLAYGLRYHEDLVQLACFKKVNAKITGREYELVGVCTNPNFYVHGGAKALLSTFEQTFNPSVIVVHCDLSKINPNFYTQLGFQLKEQLPPKEHWYNIKLKLHSTEHEDDSLMVQKGYAKIYDCGQLVLTKVCID